MRKVDMKKVVPVGGDPNDSQDPANPPRAYVQLFEDGERRMAVMMRNPDNPDAGQPVSFDKNLMRDCVDAVKANPAAGWDYGSYTLIDASDLGQEEVPWVKAGNGEPGFAAANRPMTEAQFQERVFSFGESMEYVEPVDLSQESFKPKNPPDGPSDDPPASNKPVDLSKESFSSKKPPIKPGF